MKALNSKAAAGARGDQYAPSIAGKFYHNYKGLSKLIYRMRLICERWYK
jgi:hypothetical protein